MHIPGNTRFPASRNLLHAGIFLGVFSLLAVFFWQQANVNSHVMNVVFHVHDQNVYLAMAKASYKNPLVTGNRNRMPTYPLLMSLFYDPSLSDEAFFERGKQVNIAISLLTLFSLFFLFRSYVSFYSALNAMLVTAAALWVYRAGYFQVEILYYFVFFCTFLLMCKALRQPTPFNMMVTGACAALAYFIKASVPPLIIAFSIAYGLGLWLSPPERSTMVKRLLMPVVFFLTFLGLLWPYLAENNIMYGSYFYNINSTFVVWSDSNEEHKKFKQDYLDKDGALTVSPHSPSVPTFARYLHTHSLRDAQQRLSSGISIELDQLLHSYGIGKYIFLYGALLAASLHIREKHLRPWFAGHANEAIFSLLCCVGYIALCGWWSVVSTSPRYILLLFLPLLFVSVIVLEKAAGDWEVSIRRRRMRFLTLANLLITLLYLLDAYFTIPIAMLKHNNSA